MRRLNVVMGGPHILETDEDIEKIKCRLCDKVCSPMYLCKENEQVYCKEHSIALISRHQTIYGKNKEQYEHFCVTLKKVNPEE